MESKELSLLEEKLPLAYKKLAGSLAEIGTYMELPKGYEVLREGQFVKVVPILLSGLVKVVTRGEMKDLLLYYIKPGESCMMSFVHALHQRPSTIYATVEEPSEAILIPATELEKLIAESPEFNKLFHDLSNLRYQDLLDTINQVFFLSIEERIIKYLTQHSTLTEGESLKLTHQRIANDLGTAREVVSRTLKKLETDQQISISREGISLL